MRKSGTLKLPTSVGINFLLDGTGVNPAEYITVTGNVIEGFESGIIVTSNAEMSLIISNNNAIGCTYGYVMKDRNCEISNNTSTLCDYGVKNEFSGDLHEHKFVNCTESVLNNGKYINLVNPYFCFGPFSKDAGVNVAYKILGEDVDTRIDGKINISSVTSSSSDYASTIRTVDYDGTTFTDATIYNQFFGGTSISMTQSSGINVRLFTAAARTDCNLLAKVNGFVSIC